MIVRWDMCAVTVVLHYIITLLESYREIASENKGMR